MNPGHSTAEGLKSVEDVLAQLKDQPLEANDLQKSKNQQIAGLILGRETVQTRASALGHAAVIGKDPNLVNTQLGLYVAVTSADIQRVAKEYLTRQHATVLLLTPPKQDEAPKGEQR